MNDLEKLLSSMRSLSYEIGGLLKQSTYTEYDDLSGLEINYDDADQLFLLDELKEVMEKLDDVKMDIDYLNGPIKHIGTLEKNENCRYEAGNREYTSGSGIEVLIYDDWREKDCLVKTSVEHNGNDYYLVGYKNVSMNGLMVRVRG